MTTSYHEFKYRIDAPCVLCGCKTPSEKIRLSEEFVIWNFTMLDFVEEAYRLPCCPRCKKKHRIYVISGLIICLVISTIAAMAVASPSPRSVILNTPTDNIGAGGIFWGWLIFSAILLQLCFAIYGLTYRSRLRKWLKAYRLS